MQSDRVDREMAAAILSELGQVWPWGALEILEFTMPGGETYWRYRSD